MLVLVGAPVKGEARLLLAEVADLTNQSGGMGLLLVAIIRWATQD